MADTTSSIKVSGGDYADPQLWEDDTDVSAGRWIGEIQDNSEYLDKNITFSGGTGTPDKDNFSWLRVASANKHSGVTGSGHARIRDTAGHVITVLRAFTVIEGLEIVQDGTGSSDEGIRLEADDLLVSRCIVRATSQTIDQDGLYVQASSSSVYIDNCVVYDFGRAGFFNNGATNTHTLDSCTIYNCGHDNSSNAAAGVTSNQATVTINVYNTACLDNDTGDQALDFNAVQAPTWGGTDNIATDATAESKFSTSFDSVILIDTNPASGENMHVNSISGRNFNITDEDSETVTQNGVNRSATHPAPQTTDGTVKVQDLATDINDVTRTITWSIGAFELAVVNTTIEVPVGPLR